MEGLKDQELIYQPTPRYKRVFWVVFIASAAYLGIIFFVVLT